MLWPTFVCNMALDIHLQLPLTAVRHHMTQCNCIRPQLVASRNRGGHRVWMTVHAAVYQEHG